MEKGEWKKEKTKVIHRKSFSNNIRINNFLTYKKLNILLK